MTHHWVLMLVQVWNLGCENVHPLVVHGLLTAVGLLSVSTNPFERLVKLTLKLVFCICLNLRVSTVCALLVADAGQVAAPIINHVNQVVG